MWLPDLWRRVDRRVGRAFDQGDADRAVRIAARYARLRPRDPQAWLMWSRAVRVRVYEGKEAAELPDGESWPVEWLAPAEEILRRGLARLPGNRELRSALGSMRLRRFDHEGGNEKGDDAYAIFSSLHIENPEWSDPLAGLAEVAQRALDRPEFERLVGEVERRVTSPEDPETFFWLIRTLPEVPTGTARAVQLLKNALAADPDRPEYHAMMGVLLEQDDPAEAAREFAAVQRLEGKHSFQDWFADFREMLQFGQLRWEPRQDGSAGEPE